MLWAFIMSNTPDTPTTQHQAQSDVRARIAQDAEAIGATPAFISKLVDQFYQRIRADDILAPVFASRIAEDAWPDHLMKMKRFWASVVLNAGIYAGKPMIAHAQISSLEESHFDHWLELFNETLVDIAPSEEARILFMSKATRIADSLRLGLFRYRDAASTAQNDQTC